MSDFLDGALPVLAGAMVAVLTVPLAFACLRMIRGPGHADRFVAIDMLTGVAVAIAALTMVATGRREFLDIAFGFALIGFLGTCALSALLEAKSRRDRR